MLKIATIFKTTLVAGLVLAVAAPAHAGDAPDDDTPHGAAMNGPQFTFDVVFDDDAHAKNVEGTAWRPGHDELSGRFDEGDGEAWWLYRPDGSKSLLARPADFGVEKAGDVSSLAWADDGGHLLLDLDGQVALFDVAAKSLRRLTASEERNEGAALSPDGKRVAFVRRNDLWVLDVASGEERRLTNDGEPELVWNGSTDWVYWEEIWGRSATGFWWSGDGRRIAYYHFDDHAVPVYPVVDLRPVHPTVREQRYPKAGDVLPTVELRVVDLATGATVTLATGDPQDTYLARVHWHPDHRQVAVECLNRDQNHLRALLCDSADGSCQLLAEQKWPTWVNLNDEFTFLDDGRFLWSSEETGWRHLELYAADGQTKTRLTPDGWSLTSLDRVNEKEGWVVFTAYATTALGAAERHVFRGDLGGGPAVRLTETAGWHGARVAKSGLWLHEVSDAATPPRQTIRSLKKPAVASVLPAKPPAYDLARLPHWEFFTLPGPSGFQLPAQVVKPPGFDPTRKYPVVMYHYGGPASQVVSNAWSSRSRSLWHLMLAERGFVVLAVDNEISNYFNRRSQDQAFRRFGEIEVAAQTAAVEYLRLREWADVARLGLWGWSGGGANTLYGILRRPGTWKAAVAGAPVTDWRLYDAIWIERYLDAPQDNELGYKASSALTYAESLKDHLLLVHGTGDDNVHPQNTFNMVDALIAAGKPFEMGIYPNMTHNAASQGKKTERHVYERMTEFFERHLAP